MHSSNAIDQNHHQPLKNQPALASLFRIYAARLYDSLIVLTLWIVITFLIVAMLHGKAITAGNHWFQAGLILLCYGYFAISWKIAGQTIGMRAWEIKLELAHDKAWQIVTLRWLLAIPFFLLPSLIAKFSNSKIIRTI